jgi:hypothetical protein
MIENKVLGAYASVGSLSAAEQAEWYGKAAREWGINTFEIPLLAGVPLAPELVEVFAEVSASLVVTLVAQWATTGQENPAYGLSSLDEASRRTALLDAQSILQQCLSLSRQGVGIRHVAVHTGQGTGGDLPHALALHRSLSALRQTMAVVLPASGLAVEVADSRPADHPIAFPAAKKSSLKLPELIQTVAVVNRDPGPPISLIANWGRLLINGSEQPLAGIEQILESEVPLAGVILSGAGASPDGFMDSHNSHLDPQSGFAEEDFQACAEVLESSPDPVFIGMKCSVASSGEPLSTAQVLTAQAELLGQVG